MGLSEATLHHAGYSQHRKPYYSRKKSQITGFLLRLQVKGTCKASLNGTWYPLKPGDLILSRPGESYQLMIDSEPSDNGSLPIDSADYYLYCSGTWIEDKCGAGSFPEHASIGVSDEVVSLWRRIVYEKRNIREDNAELLDYLLRVLYLTLERAVRNRVTGTARNDQYLPYRLKQYIELHATEPLTLKEIAKQHDISVSTASHIFSKTFGQSIMRYAVNVRLTIAAERLLVSDMRLEDIAEAAGFNSYPYFCRAFHARYQMPPSAYRSRRYRSTDL
ncbi:AraC family transcriptional regulator [Paenibacillus sp. GD4]|uniref:AraC family transcriptional regulator n=1 Tax=Paenibacillus sp. GD4 TaxID=3068890 RepID=UPI002796902D|nr:AraC family transcriptional regulator [Paenibacillus sp. GD4]MDQ1913912.1 AraC family transcriptional regulator [Paenibacillus sp. GD4]